MRALFAPTWLLVLGLASSACRANLPVGHFGCMRDDECPPTQRCVADRCQPIAADAPLDAATPSSPDASMDAPIIDAERPIDAPRPPLDAVSVDALDTTDTRLDAGPVPRRVRVLLAVEDDGGAPLPDVTVSIGTVRQPLSFGCAVMFDAVFDGIVPIDVNVGGISTTEVVPVRGDTLVVLGRSRAGALAPYVTADDEPPSTPPSTATLRYLNLVRRSGDGALSVVTDIGMALGAEVPFGEWSADAPTTGDAAVGLTYTQPWVLGPRILATFTFDMPRSALVVLTGDGERHPALRGAPRAIVVPQTSEECSAPVLPDPMITAANVAQDRNGFGGPRVFFCQLGLGVTMGAAVDAPSVSVTTTTFLGHDDFGLSASAGDACSGSPPRARLFDGASFDPPLLPGQRYLTIVSGVVSGREPRDWTITFVQDPPPADVTLRGAPPLVGTRYVHAAPGLAARIDVLNATTGDVVVDAMGPGSSVGALVPATDIGAFPFEIRDDATSFRIARYLAPAPAPSQGGAFVIFSHVDAFPGDEIRQDVIFTPYSQPWTFDTRRPM